MPTPQAKFPGRNDELPAVAEFVLSSFTRDLPLFTNYSNDFAAPYSADFKGLIDLVSNVVFPETLTKQGKKVTDRIKSNFARLRVLNRLTESYVIRAGAELTVETDDFGCKSLRKKIKQGNVEGVISELRSLLKNIDRNLTTLMGKGFKADTRAEMAALPETFSADNTLQNNNVQARNQLTYDNIDLFDTLYARIREVCEAGKTIHTTISGKPERIPDYTISVLIKRVRHERKEDGEK